MESGMTISRSYRPKRWVKMSDRGWYSGDDHVHMQIQSDADAERMMFWAQAEDTHLVNILEMGDRELNLLSTERIWEEKPYSK